MWGFIWFHLIYISNSSILASNRMGFYWIIFYLMIQNSHLLGCFRILRYRDLTSYFFLYLLFCFLFRCLLFYSIFFLYWHLQWIESLLWSNHVPFGSFYFGHSTYIIFSQLQLFYPTIIQFFWYCHLQLTLCHRPSETLINVHQFCEIFAFKYFS